VGRGILDHAIELAPRRALAIGALRSLGAHPLQPVKELVANLFQLPEVGDPRGWPRQRLRRRLLDSGPGGLLGIGGKLCLQARDLAAQGPAGGEGVLFGRRLDLRVEGRDLPHVAGLGHAARVDRPGQLARLDAQLPRRLGRLRRDLLQGGRDGRVRGHEGAHAVL
jgi:hypothetical protein